MPFNSTIYPRNGPKRRQKAPKSAQCAPTPRNQARAVSWATWLKIRFRGHLVHPQPPTFCGFQASESPNETPRPYYYYYLVLGHLVEPERSPARAQGGPTVGPPGSPGRKKSFFSKLFPDHLGCSNRCFEAALSPWWRVLGHGKSQNALKMGRFKTNVPAAHWWLSGNVKLGLIWGSVVHCDVFVLICCAFCMLGNVHLMLLEVLDTHLVKVQGGGGTFFGDGSVD